MKIEDLNKSQIILLTLLVSFVTSIATGIFTVTLLEQAPPAVTQTINRVVQNTIEKVVPEESGKEIQTIIIKEDDLIVSAIAENEKILVTIKENNNGSAGAVLGAGFIVSKDGLVIIDRNILSGQQSVLVVSEGIAYPAHYIATDPLAIALLKIIPTKDIAGNFKSFPSAAVGDSDALKIGQTIIVPYALGDGSFSVAKGIIAEVDIDSAKPDTPHNIAATMNLGTPQSGSPLLNTDGEVVGVFLQRVDALEIIPSNVLSSIISNEPALRE